MHIDNVDWRKLLIALVAAVLLIVGLGIIIYVAIARDRIMPTPTPFPTPTPSLTFTDTPLPPTPTAVALTKVSGTVREYSPGALIIVITPKEGDIEQIIVPENLEVVWEDGRRASPREIEPGQGIEVEGTIDDLGRLIAQKIVIMLTTEEPPTFTNTPQPPATAEPSPTAPALPSQSWQGEYYDNLDLSGSPVMSRVDETIEFHWEEGSPASQVPADGFSVRWRGRWSFKEGGYRFRTYSDDGIRLWIDGVLVIDRWRDQPATLHQENLYLEAGEHDLQVTYYENVGQAQVRVWWEYRGAHPDWRAEYYDNPALEGEPVLERNDVDIDFDWGPHAPAAQVPSDQFSVRWERAIAFEEGAYRFHIQVDDGARVWVDSHLLIDQWHEAEEGDYAGHIWLSEGSHDVRVEYYEAAGEARIHLWWQVVDTFTHWRGGYFANPDLSGVPILVRDDEEINFDWGAASPDAPLLPVDNFSARWRRALSFEGGAYRFWASADDGVRLYVDDELLIDDWRDSLVERLEADAILEPGEHTVVVEYYERGDKASIQVGWDLLPTPTSSLTATATLTLTPTLELPTQTPTWTSVPPTATLTPVPPTDTPTLAPTSSLPTPTHTQTALPLTDTPTLTPLLPTSTSTDTLSETPAEAHEETPTPSPTSTGGGG